jgi:hypothetical protein
MTATTEKQFDCMALKRRAQERIYEETANMTHAEFVAYLRKSVAEGPFATWWNDVPVRRSAQARYNAAADTSGRE